MNDWSIVASAGAVAVAGAAAGLASWAAVAPSSQLFGPTLRHTASPNKIALTFDDGPNPDVTPRLLALLERYSVPATFFLIGKFVRECPGLVQEMSLRGHLLGNHTDTHANLFLQSRSGIRDELARCQNAIAAAVAGTPVWMRPPYGYRNPFLEPEIKGAGMQGVVMWSRSCKDWRQQSFERLLERMGAIANSGGAQGDIVLLHDGDNRTLKGDRQHVVAALEHWLPRWRDAGIEFVTIDSCAVWAALPTRVE